MKQEEVKMNYKPPTISAVIDNDSSCEIIEVKKDFIAKPKEIIKPPIEMI